MLLCSNINFAAQEDESRAGDMDTVMFYPSVEIEEGGHSISALLCCKALHYARLSICIAE